MDKNKIIETAFEVIKTAVREWGLHEENCKEFPHYVDGVISMAEVLVNKITTRDGEKMSKNG